MNRAERILRANLYVRPSQLRRYSNQMRNYSLEIGNGLFTSRAIAHNTHIVSFVGEYLDDPEEIRRRMQRSARGGYMLGNTTLTAALDCFETCERGQCLASYSNCPLHCYNIVKNRSASANARLVVRVIRQGKYDWSLVSTCNIPAHEEILWNYGVGYKYPDTYNI